MLFKNLLGAEEDVPAVDPELFGDEDPVDGVGEVIELEDETEEDCAPRVIAPEPGEPTEQEKEEHRVDHLPYRCWCEFCVMGRGTGQQHRGGGCKWIPTIAFDYLFVTRKGVRLR